MRRTHHLLTGCAITLLLVACGGGAADPAASDPASTDDTGSDDTGGDSPEDTAGSDDEPTGDDAPALVVTLPLEITRDEATGQEATIGSAGGTVSATAADGSVYTLTVPPNALADDTLIRAVPATLPGLGATNWTVMFEPSGLEFLGIATLTIEPSTAVPIEQQVAFTISDDGAEVGLALIDPASEKFSVRLDHFSGYGLAVTTDRAWAAELGRQADRAERQLQSVAAEYLAQARGEQLLGIDNSADVSEFLANLLEAYRNEVVSPRLQAAGGSCADLKQAIRTVLGFERTAQLAGFGESDLLDGLEGVGLDLAVNSNKACEEEAIAECKASRSAGVLVRYRLGIERMRQLMGNEGAGPSIDQLIEEAKRICQPVRYSASGGGENISITGTIEEIGSPFTLTGDFAGGTATFTYTPGTTYAAGTLTYTGGGGGTTVSGEGSYTVSGTVGEVLTLMQTESGCTDVGGDTCRTTSETLTLTPITD